MSQEDFDALVYIAYVVFTGLLVFLLYGYIYHLYRDQKKGIRDYEKYSNMALDDEVDSRPVEDKKKEEE